MNYILVKGTVTYHIRFLAEDAEITRTVSGAVDTSKQVMTKANGTRFLNERIREGFQAKPAQN